MRASDSVLGDNVDGGGGDDDQRRVLMTAIAEAECGVFFFYDILYTYTAMSQHYAHTQYTHTHFMHT